MKLFDRSVGLSAFRSPTVLILAMVPLLASSFAPETDPTISVRARHLAHPLLSDGPCGPSLRIVIDVGDRNDVRLQGWKLQLSGDDVLGDIKSIEFSQSKEAEAPKALTVLDTFSLTSNSATLKQDLQLEPGKSFFWIRFNLHPHASLDHSIEVRHQSIETTVGMITPINENEPTRNRIGVAIRRAGQDNVHTYRIPALATSPTGTLHCVYDVRHKEARDLQGDIDIGLSRSTDGGQTWQPMQIIMDMGEFRGLPQDQNGCSDPGIVIDSQTGEIFVFALWMWGKPGKHQWNNDGSEPGFAIEKSAQLMVVRSNDDGLTWSEPENLTRTLKREEWWLLAPAPQQGINLPDGTLVMPMQGRDESGVPFATIMTSGDHGRSWTVGNLAYRNGNECQAARLDDGSIMLNIRNGGKPFRAIRTTMDLGKTWHDHPTSENTLIEPTCNASLLRFDYSDRGTSRRLLIFANPHSKKGRSHQTIQVSFDDGMTWPPAHHLLLDEGRGAGYPSLTRVDGNHLGIAYEGSQAHVVFERITLEELLRPKSLEKVRPTTPEPAPR